MTSVGIQNFATPFDKSLSSSLDEVLGDVVLPDSLDLLHKVLPVSWHRMREHMFLIRGGKLK